MNSTEAIGRVQVLLGNANIVDVKGNVREVSDADLIYHNEQLCSDDADTLLQVKYEALSESTNYNGLFNVLVDDSVSDISGHDNLLRADFDFITLAFSEADVLLTSCNTLDLSNVEELISTPVLALAKEEVLDSIVVLDLLKCSDNLQIVYEGDSSDVDASYVAQVKVDTVEDINDFSVLNVDSTMLVDIPTVIDDVVSDS